MRAFCASLVGSLVFGALLSGCSLVDSTIASLGTTLGVGYGAQVTITSSKEPIVMTPEFRTRVFISGDANTATVYLSDLTLDELTSALENGGLGANGNLIHIHMFLMPKAGETPVEFTAANATVRHYVIADGAVGMYSGGGFFLPATDPTGDRIVARLGGTTLRLAAQQGPFIDRLGTAQLAGGVTAQRDAQAVTAIASRVGMLIGG